MPLGLGSFPSRVTRFYVPSVNQGGLSEIGAALALNEADDTLSAATTLPVTANLTTTEAADTSTAAGTLPVIATLSTTEGLDTLAASAALPVTASLGATESADTLAAVAGVPVAGSLASAETNDAITASASLPVTASRAGTEADDALSASGGVVIIFGDLSMADAVTSQTLFDDGGHVVIHLTNVSDGTGESAVAKVDASTLVGGGTTTRYALEAIAWTCTGMGFNLLWDATTDVLFFSTGNASSQGFIDYINGTGGDRGPGSGPGKTGITNNAGTGINGDILLTTAGHNAGDSYVITLWLRKTAA